MAGKLKINTQLCIACGLCKTLCIRDNIEVDKFAFETDGRCFECGHCMAICPENAIILKSFENNASEEYDSENIPVSYEDMLQLLKQRRSVRFFKNRKIDEKTLNKLFKGAYFSPSAQNVQDVEFAVIDERMDEFMELVYDIIRVEEDEFFRIREFGDYLKDNSSKKYHPLLWQAKQLILTFSTDRTSAVIAGTRLELLAYSLGLGGFYSLFILKADEIDHSRLMEFFPDIDDSKHMYSAFAIGYPKFKFKRTVPHRKINITYF